MGRHNSCEVLATPFLSLGLF